MKIFDAMWALLVSGACSFIIMAQEPPFQNMLDLYDCNCNLMLEKNELPKKLRFKVFSKDSNNDGYVDRKEYEGIIGLLRPE